jgi:hypothetical protein
LLAGKTPVQSAKMPVALCTGSLSAKHCAVPTGCAPVSTGTPRAPGAKPPFAHRTGGKSAGFYAVSSVTERLKGG